MFTLNEIVARGMTAALVVMFSTSTSQALGPRVDTGAECVIYGGELYCNGSGGESGDCIRYNGQWYCRE